MASVDIARLHGDQISHELVRRVHGLLEEGDYGKMELLLQLGISAEELFVEELGQDSDEFVIDERDAFKAGFLEPFDLLFHNELKCSGAHKERGRGAGRVVEYSPNVDIFHLIEGIDSLDTVGVQLVENKTDSSAA